MPKTKTKLISVLASVALLIFQVVAIPVSGAIGAQGIEVSPVRQDITINPGQSQTINIKVVNVTANTEVLQGIVNDFVASSNETGQPSILVGANVYAPSHSLKRFISPLPNITLAPGQEIQVPVTINVPKNAAGGGYYGVVRFGPAGTGSKDQTVTLAGSVGSLVLLTVPGDIKQQLSIASFDVESNGSPSTYFTSNKHINAVIRFQNEGNIQVAPFGKILLKSRSGKIIASFNVNNVTPPGNVLPNSIRRFSIPVSHLSSFGIYTLEANFGYGTTGQPLSASTVFYVIPLTVIIGFLIFIVLILFLIFGMPKLIAAYNKRVIDRASRR